MLSHPPDSMSRVRIGLGTFIAIEARGGTPLTSSAAVEAAMACFRRVEATMHPTRPGSDLAALAAAAPGSAVRVDPWTVDVLRLAQRLYQSSNGVFDPCLPESKGRLHDLHLLSSDHLRAAAQMRLDLGGIAKGFAVDRAVEAMQAAGCESGLVNAGGDARAFGAVGFRIECRGGQRSQWIELRDGAVAASSADAEDRPPEHQGYYCRRAADGSAAPLLHRRHAIVLAPSAALADALTKCLMLAPAVTGEALLLACGARALAD